jgi:predicted TIM-barrel fold metal-dependent hydrolase
MFDRHPDLKFVSVESGIGWIPFMLEAMDYELAENAPEHAKKLKKVPSQYFTDNWFATLWFERGRGDLQHLIDTVGEDNILFETDFPHHLPAPEPARCTRRRSRRSGPRPSAR